jgi:hypothetical protein
MSPDKALTQVCAVKTMLMGIKYNGAVLRGTSNGMRYG